MAVSSGQDCSGTSTNRKDQAQGSYCTLLHYGYNAHSYLLQVISLSENSRVIPKLLNIYINDEQGNQF